MNNNYDQQNQFNNMNSQTNGMQPQFGDLSSQPNVAQPQFGDLRSQSNSAQPQFNNYPNQTPNNKNKKLILIIGAIVLVLIIAVVLYMTVFKKDELKSPEEYDNYSDYLDDKEKIEENLNENYTVKSHKITDGLLIELTNNNESIVNAEIKVEFYDKDGTLVDIQDANMYFVPKQWTSYNKVYMLNNINYATYKIKSKLTLSPLKQTYVKDVEIVSSSVQDDEYLVQIKNNSKQKLDTIEIGLLFLDSNNNIIDYESESIYDLDAGETTSEKIYIPENSNFDTIKYHKIDKKIISATAIY